jgi:hypothetical protein
MKYEKLRGMSKDLAMDLFLANQAPDEKYVERVNSFIKSYDKFKKELLFYLEMEYISSRKKEKEDERNEGN